MSTLLLPLEMHGPHGFDGGFPVLPFLGSFFLLLLLLAGLVAFALWRQGKLDVPGLVSRRSPEDAAKQILADRFARGDISSDEFMERSSILNWTPGSDTRPPRQLWRKSH